MDITDIREQIDTINNELLGLFIQRMQLAGQIGRIKAQSGLPIYSPEREQEILMQIRRNAPEDLADYASSLFSTLLELSRDYQAQDNAAKAKLLPLVNQALFSTSGRFPTKAVVACQGVEGAYSQLAADKTFSFADIMYFKSFQAVFRAIETGLCRYGVLPIENSSYGSVNAVYDLMRDHHFFIVREAKLPISHNLLAAPGTQLNQIREVLSHEQAIGQCSKFLDNMGKIKISFCENTALAAKTVANSPRHDLAAISSADCAVTYGLNTLKEGIQNHNNNFTRFIIISKEPEIYPGANKISLLFTTENQPGALNRVLSRFARNGLNLSKLESRPLEDSCFQYAFYADIDADPKESSVQRMLAQMAEELTSFVFLGAYQEI